VATEAEDLAAVREQIAAGDDDAAYARLRERMRWPAGKSLQDLPGWLAVLSELATRSGAGPVAELAAQAVRDPESPDKLYELGYALIDADAPSIAASVLWRCLGLVEDSEEIVCELVSALESALCYADAYAILEQHPVLRSRSFLCEYLFAFNAAMTGKLAVTRSVLPTLAPESPETEAMRDTIAAIVARADQIAGISPLDERDLRGWQYALTGTLVTHRSPYGFDEGMTGRYAWLRDSAARVRTGIVRVAPLVRALDIPCIYAPPGRDHETLAKAMSELLDVPVMPWPAIGVPAPGLVVLYDLAELDPADLPKLLERRPDQLLFAHASPWTQDAPVAPDVTTLLYEALVPLEASVVDIVANTGLDADETARDDLDAWAALVAATWPPVPRRRSRMWAGGPVPSNRFA